MTRYTDLDRKIDSYLGTSNLRPGPAKRLVNRTAVDNQRFIDLEKVKVNFSAYPLTLKRFIKWD